MIERSRAASDRFAVTVAYARPAVQAVVQLEVSPGSTLLDAVRQSGLLERFPEIQLDRLRLGVYGRLTAPDARLRPGDRVEIYRRLIANPKEVRRRRARSAGPTRRR